MGFNSVLWGFNSVARSSGLVYAAAAAVQGPAGSSGRLSLCFRDDQASCCGCHRSGPVYGPVPAHHPRLFRRSRAWMGQTGRCIPRAVRAGPARPRAPPRKPGNPRGQVEDQPRRIPRHDTAETVGQRADSGRIDLLRLRLAAGSLARVEGRSARRRSRCRSRRRPMPAACRRARARRTTPISGRRRWSRRRAGRCAPAAHLDQCHIAVAVPGQPQHPHALPAQRGGSTGPPGAMPPVRAPPLSAGISPAGACGQMRRWTRAGHTVSKLLGKRLDSVRIPLGNVPRARERGFTG